MHIHPANLSISGLELKIISPFLGGLNFSISSISLNDDAYVKVFLLFSDRRPSFVLPSEIPPGTQKRPGPTIASLSDFNSFVAQIRGFLCSQLSDYRGRIIPPIHSPAWRLVHADLNWDIPTTTLNFLAMTDIQVTRPNDVILRVYKKMLNREPYVRVEKGTHPFSNAFTNISFNNSIGQTIIGAVKETQKELSVGAGA